MSTGAVYGIPPINLFLNTIIILDNTVANLLPLHREVPTEFHQQIVQPVFPG